MRKVRVAVLAGAAALAVASGAVAAIHDTHLLKVALPDGSVARIEYHGDTPPDVTIGPALVPTLPLAFDVPGAFDPAPLAMVDRIAAHLEQQSDAMVRQLATLDLQKPFGGSKLDLAAYGKLPAGTVEYSFFSTTAGNSTCSRSVQVTSFGAAQPPKVISASSGDCADQRSGAADVHRQPSAAAVTTQANLHPNRAGAGSTQPTTI